MLAESGGLAPQPAKPIHLFSKQRPHLGGFTLQNGGRSAQRGDGAAPSLRGVSDGGAREAGGVTNKAVVLPHKPCGSKRLPTDHGASRFCSPKRWRRREVMLPSGAWPPNPLQTGAGASAGFASESPRGRICTCVDPLRRRRPELLFAVPPAARAPARLTLRCASGFAISALRAPSATRRKWTSRRDSHPQHGVRSAA
jgi:hypothetical protein